MTNKVVVCMSKRIFLSNLLAMQTSITSKQQFLTNNNVHVILTQLFLSALQFLEWNRLLTPETKDAQEPGRARGCLKLSAQKKWNDETDRLSGRCHLAGRNLLLFLGRYQHIHEQIGWNYQGKESLFASLLRRRKKCW